MRRVWTDELITKVKTLWEEGYSSSAIAKALGEGLTKNAVIGKIHRLKVARNTVQNIATAKISLPPIVELLPYIGQPKPLEILGPQECRYPVNTPEDGGLHLFCAAPTETVYCENHHAVVYRDPPKRDRHV